jgi:protein-L-isoaspartate(D-aspartate) O-methyltransferase
MATVVLAAAVGATIMAFWSDLFHNTVDSVVPSSAAQEATAPPQGFDRFTAARHRMVDQQLRSRDIADPNVLKAMGCVPRERFVAPRVRNQAYEDYPLPIGLGQTISQPYIVALMTQLARPTAKSRALEVGAGSGYQTAVLAELCKEVYGIEILRPLADDARARLAAMGYRNVTIRCGDGYRGWPEHAPFDVILVTAAPEHVPQPLLEQLAPGGRLVIPVGRGLQDLLLLEKRPDGSLDRKNVAPVQFVPMTGEAERAVK